MRKISQSLLKGLKITVLLTLIIIGVSFMGSPDQEYSVYLTQEQWGVVINSINYAPLDKPERDKLTNEIANQVNPQIKSAQNKQHYEDSVLRAVDSIKNNVKAKK